MNNSVNFSNFLDLLYEGDQEAGTGGGNSHIQEYLKQDATDPESTDGPSGTGTITKPDQVKS